jgi:hypothetical protein
MIKQAVRLSLLLSALLIPAAGCAIDGTNSTRRAIIDTPCATDDECPAGFECEIEEEHGTTISFCQAHGESDGTSDGTCPAGYELEIEHGQTYCQPHGGDDGSGGSDDGSGGSDDGSGGSDDGSGGGGSDECATDADCPAGLECELEHGVSFCKPHGGDGN